MPSGSLAYASFQKSRRPAEHMFPQEASWVEAVLARFSREAVDPLLDIGSSDQSFRAERQPWIEKRVFEPLRARRVQVAFCDLKDSPGVTIVADLMSDEGLERLRQYGPRTVLCCNVLEHVPDAAVFASRLALLVPPGGRIIATVPHRYPQHNDPIDTMFRPGVQALAELFPGFTLEHSAILQPGSYREEFLRRPVTLFFRHLFRLPFPFLGWSKWKRSAGKLRYLIWPYEVTCVCLVKEAGRATSAVV